MSVAGQCSAGGSGINGKKMGACKESFFIHPPAPLESNYRSTNHIERFNRELRRSLNHAGAMFGENELWKLASTIAIEQENRWDKRSFRNIKSVKELKLAA